MEPREPSTAPSEAEQGSAPSQNRSQRRAKLSCLGKSILSFVDGSTLGATIGGIISSVQAMSGLSAGNETLGSAVRHVGKSTLKSGFSIGGAIACYNGGVCSLENARGKRDAANPFLVGGLLGALSSFSFQEVHDGQFKRRMLTFNTRSATGAAISSAMLCTLFWSMQQPGRVAREERVARELAEAGGPPDGPPGEPTGARTGASTPTWTPNPAPAPTARARWVRRIA